MGIKKPLSEKDFIHEGFKQNPTPAWMWAFIIALIIFIFWFASWWWSAKLNEQYESEPFLQVTNRDISLMLWQFPEYMRLNTKNKAGYLKGFYRKTPGMEPELADQYAVAPPELLFLYHTWNNLIYKEFVSRPIKGKEFGEFLTTQKEWHPEFWPAATPQYQTLVANLDKYPEEDIRQQIPKAAQCAFQGWKNFYKEGDQINLQLPTYYEMAKFLQKNPHYDRNYWRNILIESRPLYLVNQSNEESIIPKEQLAPFLKVALFNYNMANKNL